MYQKKQRSWRAKASNNIYDIRNQRITKLNKILLEDFKERERLSKFYQDLINLGDVPDDEAKVLKFLVSFMDLVSTFQDEGRLTCRLKNLEDLQEKYDEVVEVFWETVNCCGRNSGTGKNNWNRTKIGEKVTFYNVYLDGINIMLWLTLRGAKNNKLKNIRFARTVLITREVKPFLTQNLKILIKFSEFLAKH